MTKESMPEMQNNKRVRRRASGISWRLFGTLTLFVILILVVIWIFQIVLLNSFYEKTKLDGFEDSEEKIYSYVNDEKQMIETVYTQSVKTDTCIRLFEVVDGIANEIADSDVNGGCMIHHITGDGLSRMYSQAVKNGGVYSKRMPNPSDNKTALNAVYVSVKKNTDGDEYILMMDSELVPLGAIVQTLQMQFGWIMCLLIMGALIIALAISRVICAPLEKMSRSAKRLAKGDYNAEFSGGGYREAEELGEALNFAAQELAKTDNLQKELVANISHDLRTPLTMIKGYSEVMRDIPGENNPENVQVIIDETERLTELVNDMLDLSKIRAGTRKPEPETFDLTETVRSVLQRYEKLTEKDNYIITFDADENVLVTADRTMILQVIYNLVNNALNYAGDDKRVSIVQSVWDNRVRISVIDTGVGIAPEDIPYIWDRYYKVDKVHKRAKVGTGLGLSIVKGILESHGAAYGVESRVGEGSNFWFELETFRDVDESEIDAESGKKK
ncbi:MAG: ATP-binding protein [Eubacteriales bacterium]